ncbi:unnamed protein product [Amaranthus hypochondriacus]
MESYTSYSQSSSGSFWNFDALKNFDEIFPIVQSHLKQVYFKLCCVIVASAVGSYLHILWNIGGLLTTFACLGCMACLLSTPPSEEIKRFMLLMATAALEGTSIGSLVDLVIQIDYSMLLTVFVGCAIAFGCFSVATMFAKSREFLYLGALLSSGISILFLQQFAPSIFESSAFLEFYFGVLVFVGCIVLIIMLNNSMEKNEKYKRD